MAYTFIVEKGTGVLVFMRDSAIPLYVRDLWPAVTHFYFTHAGLVPAGMNTETCWGWRWQARRFELNTLASETIEKHARDNRRAVLLQILGRAVDRHRGVGAKDYMFQDLVYAQKLAQATHYLERLSMGTSVGLPPVESNYPYLIDGAALSGLTLEQEAQQILFRVQQQADALRYSERQRREFTARILQATEADFATLQTELERYESRG